MFTDHHKDEDFKAIQQVVWKADGKKEDAVELVTPGMNSVAIATQFLIQSINVLMKVF